MSTQHVTITTRQAIALLAVSGRVGGPTKGPRGSFEQLAKTVRDVFAHELRELSDRDPFIHAPYQVADVILEAQGYTAVRDGGGGVWLGKIDPEVELSQDKSDLDLNW